MNDPFLYISALMSGLLGSAHCLGMCGGVAAALAVNTHSRGRWSQANMVVSYNIGRVTTYFLLGGLAGAFGYGLTQSFSPTPALLSLRVLAGAMMIAMALYLGGWWFGLKRIEKLGGLIWRRIQPIVARMMPVKNPSEALVLGMLWGFLPCGLVYSALTLAVTSGDWQSGATVMLCFGLGTMPSMLGSGFFASAIKSVLSRLWVKRVAAVALMVFGVWTLMVPTMHIVH